MNERVMQFRIGMFVIVAGLVLTMLIVWFGECRHQEPPDSREVIGEPVCLSPAQQRFSTRAAMLSK